MDNRKPRPEKTYKRCGFTVTSVYDEQEKTWYHITFCRREWPGLFFYPTISALREMFKRKT